MLDSTIGRGWRAVGLGLALAAGPVAGTGAGPGPGPAADPIETALSALGLARDELRFELELDPPDRFRFALATRALDEPLALEAEVERRAADWLEQSPFPSRLLETLGGELPAGPRTLAPRTGVARRSRTLAGALTGLVDAWSDAGAAVLQARRGLTPADRALVYEHSLAPDDGRHEEPDPAELDRVVALAAAADGSALVPAAVRLLAAMEAVEAAWLALPAAARRTMPDLQLPARVGRSLVLGGPGPDRHDLAAGLIVDLGGDDLYEGEAAADGPEADPVPVRVVLDLGGADRYRAGARRLAGGFLGIGLVLDREGDDSYEGPAGSLGAGILGVGVLVDRAGKDLYRLPRFGMGAGLAGIGLLVDGAGSDGYYAAGSAQGFAGLGGLGVLVEAGGHDVYHLTGGDEDFRGEYFDSFGQGVAVGLRNQGSGGLAALVDGAGNDTYQADYWAQGVGYWYGLGVLVDRAGDDRYLARRYAQGAGVHYAAGLLLDSAGQDRYVASAVAQGTGYDFGFGGLVDRGGDDTYLANDLAQGGAYANGFGLLRDHAGNDAYLAGRNDVQGHGYGMRGFSSVGILIDTGGVDRYQPLARNNAVQLRGDAGVLVDAAGP